MPDHKFGMLLKENKVHLNLQKQSTICKDFASRKMKKNDTLFYNFFFRLKLAINEVL